MDLESGTICRQILDSQTCHTAILDMAFLFWQWQHSAVGTCLTALLKCPYLLTSCLPTNSGNAKHSLVIRNNQLHITNDMSNSTQLFYEVHKENTVPDLNESQLTFFARESCDICWIWSEQQRLSCQCPEDPRPTAVTQRTHFLIHIVNHRLLSNYAHLWL